MHPLVIGGPEHCALLAAYYLAEGRPHQPMLVSRLESEALRVSRMTAEERRFYAAEAMRIATRHRN